MSYEPKPGTVAYRVLAHLQTMPRGAELLTSQIAEALRIDPNGVTPCLEAAVKAGSVFRRQRDSHPRSPFWWSLVDHSKDARTAGLVPAADGSQKPNADAMDRPGKAGSDTPPKGANRAATGFEGRAPQGADATDSEARSKVMAAEGSERPTARGENVAPALGAAPAFIRADPDGAAAIAGGAARPEETAQRGAGSADIAATRETVTGAGDDAKPAVGAAAPEGPTRFALWSDGTLHIQRPRSGFVLTVEETRELVRYLDAICLDVARGEGVAS